ncbi:MAG: preprotein translocase subunit SecY [Candidatus Desulfofervidaceae bacterium]|nr:preprotein translocase subunit SecY [Candidatus Desulfofervidaceae bacterium]
MIQGFQNIPKIPELKQRVVFTILMLAIYRLGIHIPTPGIDTVALAAFFAKKRGTLFSLIDMFSGGALRRLSIFALGIMPYISAAIIFELLTAVVPYLDKLKKEGELGRRKITQYTRYATIGLSLIQSLFISIGLENMVLGNVHVVPYPGWGFRLLTMVTLTSGTAFLMWLGEQITEKGIGNGISLIIFSGIVAGMPPAIINTFRLLKTGEMNIFQLIFLILLMVAVVAFIVFMERGQRRIPIQYARRVVGRRVYGGQSTHLPLRINTSGVIPPIFASSILMFPATIAQFVKVPAFEKVVSLFRWGSPLYLLLYVILIIFFCYFYTAIVFNPEDVADNMRKYGGYIPGIRPGKRTSEYIDKVLTRLTFAGAIYVSLVCVLPTILIKQFHVPFYFGGTALLIVVGVAIETIAQIETHLITRYYEGFLKKGKFKGMQG